MLYLKKNKPLFLFRLLSRKPLIFRLKTLLFFVSIYPLRHLLLEMLFLDNVRNFVKNLYFILMHICFSQ